jgi:hypothetical protein
VWKLESAGGCTESFLQLPKTFEQLPAKGIRLAMIPNRGVLLATGTDEPGGLAALLAVARKSMQEAPWPLCGDLFEITPAGVKLYSPTGPEANALATVQRIDISSVYADQKTALQTRCQAINDDVFVATYSLLGTKDDPSTLKSWCCWSQGIPTLLPVTDLIAFDWDRNSARKTTLVSWDDAERIAGHHFKSTAEHPPRIRVDQFPTAAECVELENAAAQAEPPGPAI